MHAQQWLSAQQAAMQSIQATSAEMQAAMQSIQATSAGQQANMRALLELIVRELPPK